MNKLNILHLSDLHFSQKEKSDLLIIGKALLNDLNHLIQTKNDLKPDLILFTGDLVFDGNRNDFYTAWNEFMKPISDSLNLDNNQIYFCPGNHDIERNRINSIVESGLKAELISNIAVNAFVDSFKNNDVGSFSRLTAFNEFKSKVESSNMIEADPFYSSYAFEKCGKKIGIVCLDSSWRAFGGDENDYGKLILGERVLDRAIASIANCDLRIGIVHHPLEHLQAFERPSIHRLVFRSFNLWFHGHLHEHDIELIKSFNDGHLLVIAGGTLYQSREYHNGYGILSLNLDELDGEIYLREYSDRARKFIEAVTFGKNGVVQLKLSGTTGALSEQSSLIARMRNTINSQVDSNLFPSISQLSSSPKSLLDVFVEPPLATESESSFTSRETMRQVDIKELRVVKTKKETIKSLNDLLASGKSILFAGKKESGKTSLLKHIYRLYLDNVQPERERIPLFIDFRDLPKGKRRIYKALQAHVINLDLEMTEIDNELKNGNCLILIDNLDLEYTRGLEDLAEFVNSYPNNRFFFTTDESVLIELGMTELPSLNTQIEKIYIHSFKRKQIKHLIEKWYGDKSIEVNADDLLEHIQASISEINLPRTPLVISMLALITEQDIEFVPINKASLIEKLLEIILEKLNPAEITSGGLDFRNKEDLLSLSTSHF